MMHPAKPVSVLTDSWKGEHEMRTSCRICCLPVLLCLVGLLAGCVYGPPGTYYKVQDTRQPTGGGPFVLGPNDQYFVLRVDDSTPFGIYDLPQTGHFLYNKGYDQVRRQREADFTVEVYISGGLRENPDLRAGNTLGGAMVGAATGAMIGAAVGDPGAGAAIGAASGGALGLISPAATSFVTVDLNVYSFNERVPASRSIGIDLSTVPPFEVRRVIDVEVSRMLRPIPPR